MRADRVAIVLFCCLVCVSARGGAEGLTGNPYAGWENGPPKDPGFFPIAVWMQDPEDAAEYVKAGVNLYVGLWKGPTEEQLAALRAAGMRCVCNQNETGLKHLDDPVIVAWMHGDEPDNAQKPVVNGVWSPPVPPEEIVRGYEEMKARDPSRPVLLNLGQGVAWNDYIGRGVRRNHPEDYPRYVKGCDIASFDIYPVTSRYPEIKGNLWYVAQGVERLRAYADRGQVVWNCIETTKIRAPRRPTPHELRAEVWMSIIHGSMGIVYFVHEWKPEVDTRRLLHDPEMLAAVTALNGQIRELAPVINSPTLRYGAEVKTSNPAVPVALMAKRYGGGMYVFSCAMRGDSTDAEFLVSNVGERAVAEVVGENRSIEVENGRFTDHFRAYDVHIYRFVNAGGN